MTTAQILPDLTPDQLDNLSEWLRRLPLYSYLTGEIYEHVKDLSYEISVLADLRRKA